MAGAFHGYDSHLHTPSPYARRPVSNGHYHHGESGGRSCGVNYYGEDSQVSFASNLAGIGHGRSFGRSLSFCGSTYGRENPSSPGLSYAKDNQNCQESRHRSCSPLSFPGLNHGREFSPNTENGDPAWL